MKYLIPLLCLFCLCACGGGEAPNPENQNGENANNVSDNSEYIQEEEADYVARVNNLKIRNEPNLKAETLTKVPEGEIVRYLGQKTKKTEKLEIRDRMHNESWYKVKYGGKTGWTYGGGLDFSGDKSIGEKRWLVIPNKQAGYITKESSLKDIETYYGKDYGHSDYDNELGGGGMVYRTTLFPESSNEVDVFWKDKSRKGVRYIGFSCGKGQSQWATEDGLKAGMTLQELIDINEADVTFSYEVGDFVHISVSSWNGGALASVKGLDHTEFIFEERAFDVLEEGGKNSAANLVKKTNNPKIVYWEMSFGY